MLHFYSHRYRDHRRKEVYKDEYTPENISSTSILYGLEENEGGLTNLKYATYLNDYKGLDYIVIDEGKEFRKCYLPKGIIDGNRHRWIIGYAKSILFNNPSILKEILFSSLWNRNNTHCFPPLNSSEITNIVNWYHDKHVKGILDYHPKLKKIWFDPFSNISADEKKQIVGKETGKLRRKRTIKVLKSVYSVLSLKNNKVTQKMVADSSKLSRSTVKKYWLEIIE
jgi:hypothetical protein